LALGLAKEICSTGLETIEKLLDCCLQSIQLWNGDGQTKEQSSNYIIHNIIIGLLKILTSQPKGCIKFKRLLNYKNLQNINIKKDS
jgi:hypothetical protein